MTKYIVGCFISLLLISPAAFGREAKPLTEPAIKEVPTFTEVEAAKVKATAETALEVSRKAEAVSEQAIASANQSIEMANQAIDKTNQAIDQVNAINEKVMQENAKLRFEMEQKNQGLSDEMANLKKEIEKFTVKKTKKLSPSTKSGKKVQKPVAASTAPAKATSGKPVVQVPK